MYVYMYIYIYVHTYPPNPMYNLCSLPDCQISGSYFTYRSLQILKICSGGLKALKSDPPQKIMQF